MSRHFPREHLVVNTFWSMHSSFYSCLGRVLIILSAPSEVFSSPRPPRQAPQLLSECLIKLPLIFCVFFPSALMSVGWYTDHHPPKEQTPQFCLWEFPPFPLVTGISHELEQLVSDFTLWGLMLKMESSGGERASMQSPEAPAYGQFCFPVWGAAVTLGRKAGPPQ